MKRALFIIFVFIAAVINLYSEDRFYIRGRSGILIKVDPVTAFESRYAETKGPRMEQIPAELMIENFNELVNSCGSQAAKDVLNDSYTIEGDYGYAVIRNDLNEQQKTSLRNVFLILNRDNEIPNGLMSSGSPSPHRFPRVFNAESKPYFDITFNWGVKFDNNITLDFGVNLSNFVMPSLEIGLKYNFIIPGYPVEPFIGGVLYGGFMDGFPIGLSAVGGVDVFPCYFENLHSDNFFITAELRLGAVLFVPVYFDTGRDDETIYKELGILAEGGFYLGSGYIFDK